MKNKNNPKSKKLAQQQRALRRFKNIAKGSNTGSYFRLVEMIAALEAKGVR